MPGNSGGFAIGISVQDAASAKIDALNKRIAALNAPADRFNKSMKKFGEVTGISRGAEAIQGYGDKALGAARALERMASPLALLTSAGSIAGVVELTNRWADAGNTIGKTANLLRMPVEQLGNLKIAAKIAGSSAEALESSMQGLSQTLSDARYNRAGNKMGLLENVLHIDPRAADGTAKTATDVLDKVADAVKARHADPTAQKLLLESLGMSADLIPLLDKGATGLAEFKERAAKSGGAMTAGLVANATKMKSSWEELVASIEGVDNRIIGSWSGTAEKAMDTASHWIEKNKDLADSYTKTGLAVGGAITTLLALKPTAWVLRALGLGFLGTIGGAVAAEELTYQATQIPSTVSQADENKIIQGSPGWQDGRNIDPANASSGWSMWNAFQFGGGRNFGTGTGGGGPRLPGPRAGGSGGAIDDATRARAVSIHDGLVRRGMDSNTAWGFAGNAVQESRAMWNSEPGDMGAAHGLMMWRDSADGGHRYSDYVKRWGHAPEQGSQDEALDNIMSELNGPESAAWRKIQMAGNTPGERGAAISQFYERPKDTDAENSRRWGLASDLAAGAQNGHVAVEVTIRGAPHGTTAAVTSNGAVVAPPPRVETSMPGAH